MLTSMVTALTLSDDPSASIYGCSMDGCAPGRHSFVGGDGSAPPIVNASVERAWTLALPDGVPDPAGCATPNLGCSTNGNVLACAMRATEGLLSLSSEGESLWNSSYVSGLSPLFRGGSPVLDDLGRVAGTDGDTLVYHQGDGTLLWSETISDKGVGALYSPGATSTKLLPLTLGNGHYSVYQPAQGMCWASLALGESPNGRFFDRPVTPAAARGERTYVLTKPATASPGRGHPMVEEDAKQLGNVAAHGPKLYAVDATLHESGRLDVQWAHGLCGLSAVPAAPLALAAGGVPDAAGTQVLFFASECVGEDGGDKTADASNSTVKLISLLDSGGGAAPTRMWTAGGAALADSPVGLVWDGDSAVWAYDGVTAALVAFNLTNGAAAGAWPLGALGAPRSRAVVATDPATGHAVLTASFGVTRRTAVVAALDLVTGATLWSTSAATTVGQPVLVNAEGGFTVVAFVDEDGAVTALKASSA